MMANNVIRVPRFDERVEEVARAKYSYARVAELAEAAALLNGTRALMRRRAEIIASVVGVRAAARILRDEAERLERGNDDVFV